MNRDVLRLWKVPGRIFQGPYFFADLILALATDIFDRSTFLCSTTSFNGEPGDILPPNLTLIENTG